MERTHSKMYALVVFTDKSLYICKVSDITAPKKKLPSVKYSDRKKYAARILALHESRQILQLIQSNMMSDTLSTHIEGFKYTGKEMQYSNIIQQWEKYKDNHQVYLEKSILPFKTINGDDYIFSITENLKTLEYFDDASLFHEVEFNTTNLYNFENSHSVDGDISGRHSKKPTIDKTDNENGVQNQTSETDSQESNPQIECIPATVSLHQEPRIISIVDIPATEEVSCNLDTTYEIKQKKNDQLRNETDSMAEHAKELGPNSCDGLDSLNPVDILGPGVNLNDYVILSNQSFIPPFSSSKLIESATNSIEQEVSEVTKDDDDNPKDKDYIPPEANSPNMSTGSMSDGHEVDKQDLSNNNKNPNEGGRNKQKDESILDITPGNNVPGLSAPDDEDLIVLTSATPIHKKKHFCMYCFKFQSKLARHLECVHRNEPDVKKFLSLPARVAERLKLIAKIRKRGNHIYNTDKRFNDGQLLVCRRPNERMKKTAVDFLPCGNCKGQYARSVIRHHWAKCTKRKCQQDRIVMVKGRKVSGRLHAKANSTVRKHIFPYMREDEVVRRIRYDELIILYANKQAEKYGTHQHHYQMIRARLRLLGRFFIAIKQINNAIKKFADICQPRHYDDTVQAVKIVAGFDEDLRTFEHPAVASNLGTLIKHVAELLRSEYIKSENANEQKRVEDFLKLRTEDFGTSVNRAVTETQMQLNRRKTVVLPNTDDIVKLHNYLKAERSKSFNSLRSKFSNEIWRRLAEVTLVSLQVLNRRRAGEIERVYIEDFNSYQGIDKIAQKETYTALSKVGQSYARKYVRFMIRGKRGRGVPVLVPSELLECLILVKDHRTDAGVSEKNPYLFGIPSTDVDRFKYLRACNLLRQYAEDCGASLPCSLRGTELRKHIATKCMDFNLSENQVADLANFMGHHEKIHKEIYRQPLLQNDIVKISQLLEAAQGMVNGDRNQNESETESESESDDDGSSTKSDENNETRRRSSKKKLLASNETEDESSEAESEPDEYEDGPRNEKKFNSSQTNCSKLYNHSQISTKKRKWTDKERYLVLSVFEDNLKKSKLPTGKAMQDLIKKNSCLQGRTVAQMRTWLYTNMKNCRDD